MSMDLRQFLHKIEAAGELRKIRVPVSPKLEITEICQRVVQREGPALLFENVEGSDFRLAINLFGSRKRLEIAVGGPPATVGERLLRLAQGMMPPTPSALLKHARDLPGLAAMRPRRRRGGPAREETMAPDLTRLPILTCWPGDGGPFLTFPLVHTRSPRTGAHNVGIYRMHVYDSATTGMHWQIGKGGGYHHHEAELLGRDMPVAVAFGGDPLLMLAAMMPLPEGLPEAAFVGLVRGRGMTLSRGVGIDVDVPASAEFVFEGVVPLRERRVEGPFGDHYGHYSSEGEFPIYYVQRIFHRKNAIFPATVVGKPPQEDGFMGNAVQEMLGPLIRLPHPEIVDVWSVEETGFHPLLVAAVRERFTKEAMRSAMGLLGQGQLGLTKVVVMLGETTSPRDIEATWTAVADHFDPAHDFHLLTRVPFDTLDFTSASLNLGSRMILDATPRGRAVAPRPEIPDLSTIDSRVHGQAQIGPALLAIRVEPADDARDVLANVLQRLPGSRSGDGSGSTEEPPPNPKLVVAVSPDVPLDDRRQLLWGIFTRFDPARDVFFEESQLHGAWPVHRGRMAIDATFKPGYPEPLVMDPEVVKRVDQRWDQYGIDA